MVDGAYTECRKHPGVVYRLDSAGCPRCNEEVQQSCLVPDAPDAPSVSPIDLRNVETPPHNASPPNYTGTPPDLIQALQANTRAQLELSKAILSLVRSISELIDAGTVDDSDDGAEDFPGIGLDGLPIPRN